MSPHFADLRTITGGAESRKLGYDPMVNNPGDPWGRLMNYPRIWESLYVMGVDQSDTTYLGIILIALFFAGIYLFVPHANNITVGLLVLGILSPAVLFGVERANTDLLAFFLLSLAVFTMRRSGVASMVTVVVGFFLKLFPVFGLVILLRENRDRFVKLAIASGVLITLYVVISFHDLKLIFQGTPRVLYWSYGLDNLWMNVQNHSFQIGEIVRKTSYLIGGMTLVLAFAAVLRDGTSQAGDMQHEPYLDSFRAGSAVYIGTFLMGDNWDYRLMFLLLTVPQLFSWVRSSVSDVSRISTLTLVALYISLWRFVLMRTFSVVPAGGRISFLLDEVSTWLVFVGLQYLLFYSMPGWVKQSARRWFLKPAV